MPIPAALVPALISAAPAVSQFVTGLFQGNKSKKLLEGLERPQYEIPEAATQALQNAQVNAGSFQMAGQSNLEAAQDQIFTNTVEDVGSYATSGPEALAALISAGASRQGAQNQIGFQAAGDYNDRQGVLRNQLGTYAGYQDKAFDINQMQPYEDKAATASALGNAGMNNRYGAFNTLAGVAANYFDAKSLTDNKEAGGITGGAKGMFTSTPTTAAAASTNNFNEDYNLSDESKNFLDSLSPDTMSELLEMLGNQPSAQFGLYGPNSAVQPMYQ